MSHRDEILQQALTLSHEDRAFLAEALQESLPSCACHPNPSSGSDLTNELRRRSFAYRQGRTEARDVSVVLSELRQRQKDDLTL